MKGRRIAYSIAEMNWLEANRTMVISDYHRAFCAVFDRADVSAIHLHALRKRKKWKIDKRLARGRVLWRHTKYSDAEIEWLHTNRTLEIATYHRAFCDAFQRSDITAQALNQLRKKKRWRTGRTGRFNKGHEPWTKGKKLPFNANSARTQFKKGGARSGRAIRLYRPIGSVRLHRSGYLQQKIHDGFPMQSRWRFVHLLNWEKAHGPIPSGMALKCKGVRRNTDPSNWELVPRGLLPRLNGKNGRNYDGAPEELKPTIMAVAKLEHKVRAKNNRVDVRENQTLKRSHA